MQARGPASEKFAEFLAAECSGVWQSGRQMCEELSLTGNNCTNRRHTIPGQEPVSSGGKEKKVLPSMQCSSGVQYIAACNCGRRQANREDPFRLVEANYNFYQQLEEECCKDLEHVEFPVYIPAKVNLVTTEKIKLEVREVKEEEESQESPEQGPTVPVPEVKV